MNTQITAIPKLYIGMDMHKKSWALHFRTDLFDHRGFSMPPEQEVLYRHVSKTFPDHEVYLAYEVGCCGFSAARYFLSLGWQVTVVNPGDIPISNKQLFQKTDKIDCRNLCKQLMDGRLKCIHIPTESQDHLKVLLRQRNSVVKQLRREKQLIKSMLLYMGLQIPKEYDNPNWSKNFLQWLQEIEWAHTTSAFSMQSKLRILEILHKEYLETGNALRAYCRKYYKKDYYLLKSIPGIGGFLAAALLAELGDIRRFSNENEFSSYIGMVPGIRQSGETEQHMGVTPRCNSSLRSYLIEAAWITVRLDPEMQAYYRKHSARNSTTVIVKVAHKLVKRILSVIKSEQPYRINYEFNKKNIVSNPTIIQS